MRNTSPTQLFQQLITLLQAEHTSEAAVRQRLQPFTTQTHPIPPRLGRTYLLLEAPFFRVTATFEGPAKELYHFTLRLTPAAYAAIETHAQQLPNAVPGARWRARWLGLVQRLDVPPVPEAEAGVTAHFVGLLPQRKLVLLSRSTRKPGN